MKKSKILDCYLDIEPYRRRVFITRGSFSEIDARLKKVFGKECGAPESIKDAWGAVWRIENTKKNQSFFVLWLDDEGDDSVSHEVFHLTKRVMEMANIPLNEETDESWAYLNGWLNGKIQELLKKTK